MSGLTNTNLQIPKTIKLFIGGEFPRTESGRSFPLYTNKTKKVYANLCKASRKDLRNAITAAQGAQSSWASRSAYNRGQILYRMAEMTEGKRQEFVEILTETAGLTKAKANSSVDTAIDAFVYFAGFTDKYQQLVGTVNPVSGPHHNFTSCEPVGTVGLICNDDFDLGTLVAQIAAIIASGNSLVALMAQDGAGVIAPLSEVLATSDLPKGVVNLLTGDAAELYKQFGTHMEIQSLSYQNSDSKILGELKEMGAGNLKRVVPPVEVDLSLEHLLSYVEYKTVWHPIGY
ncbi:MAG: aldehyde dehydrogenase family protein [Bdellovibrionota bacterium]